MIIEKLLLELKKEIDKEIEKRDNTIRSLREDKIFRDTIIEKLMRDLEK